MKNSRLVKARKKKGFTQAELAQILGYKGKQTIANWENGHSKPPLNKAIEMAIILESDVAILFGSDVQETYTKSFSA
ncbi:helix-turn-helix transcriptional regulator [Fictibacillus sp. 23RED33]|uniref:helix-turn-helix transcriptional regulator n=1 Tax=Fictibacillus sp. 23RED33 TaxID=2745879 RepID=UPI0018CCD27C|nr:helix-turn-helix transcriptional regulator [Fictibacillus sp. 23RED33]MBH0174746.1 helix-turn-helix transcriptional regulator [Fictibacillus sp. 23RED33]